MDGCRPVSRADEAGKLSVSIPTAHAAQTGRVDRDTSEERRARTTMLRGRVPAPDIFSGRERVSRQPENAEPRHPMEVFSQLAPKTACSLVQWPAQHAQLEQRASHAAVR